MPSKHFSWERGVIIEDAAAMVSIMVGVFPTQKTVRTKCERRVKVEHIDNLMPDCMDCRKNVVQFAKDMIAEFERIRDGVYGPPATPLEQLEECIGYYKKDIERYGC